jgi:hypothetical protein
VGNVTKVDADKEFEQIVFPVVESVLHFFKIHGKMIFGNSPIIVQDMLRVTPKSFNAVNVILGALVHQMSFMLHCMMLTQPFKGIVASELVRKIYRTLSRFLSDDGHEFLGGDSFNHSRVDSSIALQKAKNNAFTLRTTSALALASAAKVALVQFNLPRQFAALKLSHMIDRLSESLVHSRHRLVVYVQVVRQFVCRLDLVKAFQNGKLSSKLHKAFLPRTLPALHIAAAGAIEFERTAKNTLPTPQKVGRTTENILSPCNHMGILVPRGYVSH